jgi:hypothetical protein
MYLIGLKKQFLNGRKYTVLSNYLIIFQEENPKKKYLVEVFPKFHKVCGKK